MTSTAEPRDPRPMRSRVGLLASVGVGVALALGVSACGSQSAQSSERSMPTEQGPYRSAGPSDPPSPPPTNPSGGATVGGLIAVALRLPPLHNFQPRRALSTALRGHAWQEVAVLQLALRSLGFPRLAVDGYYGPSTEQAVRKFQGAHGITVDGIVGPETLRTLIVAMSDVGGAVPATTSAPWVPTTMQQASPTAICADGWQSYSSHHQGTCSSHGGVSTWTR